MPILTRKIRNLPSTSSISDNDVLVAEDSNVTHKITFSTLINFICNHPLIKDKFVQKGEGSEGSTDYVTLNSDQKIDSKYLTFGKTAGTIYEGSNGATLETSLSSHKNDKTNPHAVTKAQVGLGNVDNTADSSKNVLSASKLTTARSINGTSFDGSKDITTSKWGTSRTITLQGDVSGSVTVDGSKDIAIDTTVTGMITTLPSGSTTQKGIVQLTDSISSTSTTTAATPNSVKTAYDLANSALPKSGGTMTGNLILNAAPTSNLQAATKKYVDDAKASSNSYTDTKITQLVDGAPETLDTLSELANAIQDNEDVVDLLNSAIGSKANQSELTSHEENDVIHITAEERERWNNNSGSGSGSGGSTIEIVPISEEEIDEIISG